MELTCTIAIDTPEAGGSRLMGMMLAMSVVRSPFDGDVVIFRTGEVPGLQSGAAMPQPGASRNAVSVTPASSGIRSALPAVQDEIPNEAVEVRTQRSACVVEAVRDVGRIAAEFGGTFRDAGCWKQRAGLVLREGNRYDLQTRGACVPIA